MKKVFLVWHDNGDPYDRERTVVEAFDSKKKAKQYIQERKAQTFEFETFEEFVAREGEYGSPHQLQEYYKNTKSEMEELFNNSKNLSIQKLKVL